MATPATGKPTYIPIGKFYPVLEIISRLRGDGALDGVFPHCPIFGMNPLANHRVSNFCLPLELKKLPRLIGQPDFISANVQFPYAKMRGFGGECDAFLRCVQFLFFLKQITDINAGADVTDKLPLRIITRIAFVVDITVCAIVPAQTVFHRERSPCVKCGGVGRETFVEIIRMHTFAPAIAKLFLHFSSSEIEPCLVNEGAELVRAGDPDEDRGGVGHVPETRFTFHEGTLGPVTPEKISQER